MKLADFLNLAEMAGQMPKTHFEAIHKIDGSLLRIKMNEGDIKDMVMIFVNSLALLGGLDGPGLEEMITDVLGGMEKDEKKVTVIEKPEPEKPVEGKVKEVETKTETEEPPVVASLEPEKVEEESKYAGEYEPDGVISALVDMLFEGARYMLISANDISQVISEHSLDARVSFTKDTGLVVNEAMPREFRPAKFSVVKSKKTAYLEMEGYKSEDEDKNFGTPKMGVRVFDTCILNKMSNKGTVIASGLPKNETVGEVITKGSHYLIEKNTKEGVVPIAMVTIIERER